MLNISQPNTAYPIDDLPLHIANLVCVRTGKAMPFTREQSSAIDKSPISEPTAVNFMGLLPDEQADRRNHGGPLKAVHQMPIATYKKINDEFELKVEVGSLGENLTTEPANGFAAMDEQHVCIGDVYQYGGQFEGQLNSQLEAQYSNGDTENDTLSPSTTTDSYVRLRIVQPRRPCYKINDKIGHLGKLPNIASWMSKQGIAGWYFEVVQDGILNADLPVYLIERPYPFATLDALWRLSNYKGKVDAQIIDDWLAIECLEPSWKKVLSKKRQD